MKRVLILGGGFGGIAAARKLRHQLDPHDEVVLVDRHGQFMVGFRKTWALTGQSTLEEGQRPIASLGSLGIRVIREAVTAIDPQAREARVGDQLIAADALIIALGADLAPEVIPGFQQYALNVYDRREIPRAAAALRGFRGGRLVIGIFGAPYKCPPGPYELALLVNDALKARGVDANIELCTPQPIALPVLGPAHSATVVQLLTNQGIAFLADHKATGVEAGQVVFGEERRPFDLLLGIPPHRAPAVLRESGLVDASGWISADPRTLETSFPGVYAVGDVVQITLPNGKPLPKAGIFAEAMGETAADRIAANFTGKEPEATFRAEGGCYLEVGGGQAMMVKGNFLAAPEPEVSITEVGPQYMDEKRAFETEHLQSWFG